MAEVTLPAGLKMQRLMAALVSGTVTPLDFCILFVLYSEVDRRTGITEISHEELAGFTGKKKRTMERTTSASVNPDMSKSCAGRLERPRVVAPSSAVGAAKIDMTSSVTDLPRNLSIRKSVRLVGRPYLIVPMDHLDRQSKPARPTLRDVTHLLP